MSDTRYLGAPLWQRAFVDLALAIRMLPAFGRMQRHAAFTRTAQALQETLLASTPYAWGTDATRAVLMASESIPVDTALGETNIGRGFFWWWFETPLEVAGQPIRGLSFAGGTKAVYVAAFIDDPVNPPFLAPLVSWQWLREHSPATLPRDISFDEGRNAFLTAAEGISTATHIASFVLAGCAWLRQQVVLDDVRTVERHERKRWKAETGRDAPPVHVVLLRKKASREGHDDEQLGEGATESERREWSCRWVVGGHWRNQWYASKKAHQVIWIHAYVKGPDDAPLKERRTAVVVDR